VDLDAALSALAAGELIGFPTDTVYGVAADPMQEDAVGALFRAKGRPGVKPIPILAASLDSARTIAVLPDQVADHWPGALTVVAPRNDQLPPWVGDAAQGTVGVRVPAHPTALAILEAAGPLAVTSANRSDEAPARNEREAEDALGGAVAVYLTGESGGTVSSTVVDLAGPEPRVLRQGPIIWGAA